jgi:hypothetical protein
LPTSDHHWLYWGFIILFHLVPFAVTAYLASEFFQHPNLYYRDDSNQRVWVAFFSGETWNFGGLWHICPISLRSAAQTHHFKPLVTPAMSTVIRDDLETFVAHVKELRSSRFGRTF